MRVEMAMTSAENISIIVALVNGKHGIYSDGPIKEWNESLEEEG
jgi:hypothetical protein